MMVCQALIISAASTDWVFRLVRIRAVSAHASDGDVDGIDICGRVTFGYTDAAGFKIGLVMETDRKIRFSESVIKSVFE